MTKPLPEDVRLVLAAIAQEVLESGTQDYSLMLKNQEVAEQLGWTKKRFDHKLDGICKYFASFGVGNTVGAKDLAASNRRIKVIQHAIEAKLITRADLKLVRQAQQQAGNA
ncbi:hypothetical protein [Corynebacterium pseudopelargi]|uniref:Uncharacterized protein n=1 Tax=Corynebacterium pseudopelargi TaxID=2080757 RepID=A0A3G6IV14_9CORY|nr:hypothetical protein [Corynebacterium pseudopelargi]AZA08458.1 hypothetical protein CPPEL_01555 [Corynebacterium pseudopelargi]